MTSGFDTDDCEKSSNAQMPVDLRLAHTYVPALSCLTRSSLLVLLISRPWSAASVPVHTLLCICLLADRVIRHESIFDSNSLMCTIAAASFVNTLRTGPMDGALTIVNEHQRLASNVAYAGISLLLLLGYDVGSMGIESAFKTGLGVANLPSRPLTVVLHCVLLALAVQTKLSPDAMGTHSIMFRSYAFLCLSVGWVYAVGIPEMVALLGSTTRRPTIELKGHPSTEKRSIVISTCMVQSFLPCQLRFACVLFCDGWIVYALVATMCTIVVYRVYLLGTRDLQECVHPEYSSNGAPLRCANEPLTPLYTTYDSSKIHPTADGVGRVSITPSRAFLLRPSEHEAPVANAKPQKRITTQQPTEKADDEDDTVRLFMQAKRIAESNI